MYNVELRVGHFLHTYLRVGMYHCNTSNPRLTQYAELFLDDHLAYLPAFGFASTNSANISFVPRVPAYDKLFWSLDWSFTGFLSAVVLVLRPATVIYFASTQTLDAWQLESRSGSSGFISTPAMPAIGRCRHEGSRPGGT